MSIDEPLLGWVTATPGLLEQVFDSLPDVLFYMKDADARYLWANATLLQRSGLKQRQDLIGKTADQIFPASGPSTMAQDLAVIDSARPLRDQLRLYRAPRGERYWCLSSKFPLMDRPGRVVGLAGLSRDLPRPNERHRNYHRLDSFLRAIDDAPDQNVSITQEAERAAISVDTLNRLVLDVFHLTPKQLVLKKRIDRACQLLEDGAESITDVAASCGYADHSAFSRQFKAATHTTPAQYRAAHRSSGFLSAAHHANA